MHHDIVVVSVVILVSLIVGWVFARLTDKVSAQNEVEAQAYIKWLENLETKDYE